MHACAEAEAWRLGGGGAHLELAVAVFSAASRVEQKRKPQIEWDEAHESALVVSAQRGDAAALRELLVHFSGPLFRAVILPGVGHRADAEDILRETLARAAERIGDYRPREGASLWSWMRRIAQNRIIDRARRLAARRRLTEAYEAEVSAMPPRVEAGAESEIIEEEERAHQLRQLEAAMGRLKERHRHAIELRVVQERSREECAAELSLSVGAFDVLLHRAMGALKKAWHAG